MPTIPLLRLGCRDLPGETSVATWQATLTRLGYPCGTIDGIYGIRTDAATRRLQRAAGVAIDGVVGPATRAAAEAMGRRDTTPTEPVLDGVDVSAHQGAIRWHDVVTAGKRFAILKATEGATWTDECFAANWRGARGEKLKITAYHYFKATSSTPEAQAAHFLDVYRSVGGNGDLPVAVDVEEIGRGQAPADLVQRVLAFVAIVEAELGVVPLLYTYTNFAKQNFAGNAATGLVRLPLWLACYRSSAEVPPPWSDAGRSWAIWQTTGKGRCPGVTGDCDLNVMHADALGLATGPPSG